MKKIFNNIFVLFAFTFTIVSGCKKRDHLPVDQPPLPEAEQELITTFKLILKDSVTSNIQSYVFKDPDGDGGEPAFYGPSLNTQTDSVIYLNAGRTYYAEVLLLDETKNPVDTISNEVRDEGDEHMLFYNHEFNTIENSANPYRVRLNGPDILVTYEDLDAGLPPKGIGLLTKWKTPTSGNTTKHPLVITLKHQPEAKDGTYAPGETDIEVKFKIVVN